MEELSKSIMPIQGKIHSFAKLVFRQMWSNKQEKLIRSLRQKKYRKLHQQFVVEGFKSVNELINSDLSIEAIYLSDRIADEEKLDPGINFVVIPDKTMQSISSLSQAPGVLALVKIPDSQLNTGSLVLFLEELKDPGNLGTIIRTAEGFGVSQLVLSPNCVDPFSPKVVQASMGSLFRLPIVFGNLDALWQRFGESHAFYAADMQGESVYQAELRNSSVLIMGSESRGLSKEITKRAVEQLTIPTANSLESLNVAVSTAVLLAEFRRRFPL